jgi:phosphoglycolate phosphatase
VTIQHLILFDIDGTLLKTQGAGRVATKGAMLEVFGTASTIDTHHFGGKTDFYTLLELLTPFGISYETVRMSMDAFVEAMGRHMAESIQAYPAAPLPGALEAVDYLLGRENVMLGLVTGNAPTSACLKLESAGFDPDWFAVGAYGSEAVNRDDLPNLALKRAIQYAGHDISPQQAIIIGDTALDVQAARANNMGVIGVRCGFEQGNALIDANPDVLIDDLSSLFDVLNV